MTDLAGQTSLSTSGVTRVVDRMDRDGLVRREACPSDRRSSYAVITDAGLTRLDEVLPGHLELVSSGSSASSPPSSWRRCSSRSATIRDAVNPCATAGSGQRPSTGGPGALMPHGSGTGRSTGRTRGAAVKRLSPECRTPRLL